jgi:hypothetical protein
VSISLLSLSSLKLRKLRHCRFITGRWQVSTAGGSRPNWRKDGKELFFFSPEQQIMAVDVNQNGASLQLGTPHALFKATTVSLSIVGRHALQCSHNFGQQNITMIDGVAANSEQSVEGAHCEKGFWSAECHRYGCVSGFRSVAG